MEWQVGCSVMSARHVSVSVDDVSAWILLIKRSNLLVSVPVCPETLFPIMSGCTLYEVLRGHARHVMRILQPGHRESVYHKALITALNKRGIFHRSEVVCPIMFMGECVGFGKADLVLDDVVVEIKANRTCPSETSPQLKKYIESLCETERKMYKGMVINFNQQSGLVEILEEQCTRVIRAVSVRGKHDAEVVTAAPTATPSGKRSRLFRASNERESVKVVPAFVKRRRIT